MWQPPVDVAAGGCVLSPLAVVSVVSVVRCGAVVDDDADRVGSVAAVAAGEDGPHGLGEPFVQVGGDGAGARVGGGVADVMQAGQGGDEAGTGNPGQDRAFGVLDAGRQVEVLVGAGVFDEELPAVAVGVEGGGGDAGRGPQGCLVGLGWVAGFADRLRRGVGRFRLGRCLGRRPDLGVRAWWVGRGLPQAGGLGLEPVVEAGEGFAAARSLPMPVRRPVVILSVRVRASRAISRMSVRPRVMAASVSWRIRSMVCCWSATCCLTAARSVASPQSWSMTCRSWARSPLPNGTLPPLRSLVTLKG